jgi:hypothetical protein
MLYVFNASLDVMSSDMIISLLSPVVTPGMCEPGQLAGRSTVLAAPWLAE